MAPANDKDQNRPVLVVFRNDLRLADNRALAAACDSGKPVICAFILDDESSGIRAAGAARRWWLHHSLKALVYGIDQRGGTLLLRRGATGRLVETIVDKSGADTVLWNRRYDPTEIAIDAKLKSALRANGYAAQSFDGQLLHEPSLLKTGAGGFYKVYSPFWRAMAAAEEPRDPVDTPKKLDGFGGKLASDRLEDWQLLPAKPDWAEGFSERWSPGEAGAHEKLADFIGDALDGYGDGRDRPGKESTSRLSPHLAHGEITPFQIFSALKSKKVKASAADAEKFRKEIGWREFSYHLLFHNPDLRSKNFNGDFDSFPWAGTKGLKAWQRGQTGYPIVDAGMRELWRTGWMHNRVRMIAASFLIKHLLIDWRHGEKWFWDTLVDADPANNPASWQWVAGSGADAAPYFRIFNPILQGEKFDTDGTYVRHWVPELAKLPGKYLHRPWEAPKDVLAQADVKLGDTYPVPVIDHQTARDRAMQAYGKTRGDT